MNKLTSLEDVNALALPANVLVLLTKYATALRAKNGTVIKLSSLRVFLHVHRTCLKAKDTNLNTIYHQILTEVNSHIENETMFTNEEKNIRLNASKNNKTTINKRSSKGSSRTIDNRI